MSSNRIWVFTIILSMIVLVLSIGCVKTVYVPQKSYYSIVDTVTKQLEDSATIRALFACDSLGKVYLRELDQSKGQHAKQDIFFANDILTVSTKWKTKYIDRIIQTKDTIATIQTRDVIRENHHTPAFLWWSFAIALLSVGYLVFKIILKFK